MKIAEFFKEDNGNYSSIRLIQFIGVVTILANWTWFNVSHGTIAGFSGMDLTAFLGLPGIKTIAKTFENKGV